MRKHPASMTPAERDAARFHPAGWAAIRCKDGESVVYYGTNRDGKPAAAAYRGKAIRCEWSYYFGSEQKRAARVQEFIASVAANVADKAKRQAERKAFQHTLQVGDVLRSSWGYDQTNIDYYQVTRRSDKCVWVRPIKSRRDGDGWTGDCVSMPGEFKGEETRHAVTQQNSLRGRWSHRAGGYVMSPAKAAKFERLYAEGWDASAFTGKLEPPCVSEPSVCI